MPNRGSASALQEALEVQLRVIYALMMREMQTRFGRDNIGYLWAILEPILFMGVLLVIRTFFMASTPHGMPLVPFLVTGLLPFLAFRQTAAMSMSAMGNARQLLMLPVVTPLDLVLARVALQIPTMVCTFLVVDLLMVGFGFSDGMDRPLGVGVALILAVLLGFGVGAVLSVLIELFPWVQRVVEVLFRPLFLASGLFFTAAEVPEPFRSWFLWNPLLHVTEMVRSAYFAAFDSPHADPRYVITWIGVTAVLGLLLQRTLRPYLATQ